MVIIRLQCIGMMIGAKFELRLDYTRYAGQMSRSVSK